MANYSQKLKRPEAGYKMFLLFVYNGKSNQNYLITLKEFCRRSNTFYDNNVHIE